MLALFWIISSALGLTLIGPPLVFVYLSLEPHLGRRPQRAVQRSQLGELAEVTPLVEAAPRSERATLRPAA